MKSYLCFNVANENGKGTFNPARFRRRRIRKKGKIMLRYYEDKMTGHLYALEERRLA